MSKPPKRPRDPNQLGKLIVDLSVGEAVETEPVPDSPAVEFARLGGLKGGQARAQVLTPERRREIARIAARKRWGDNGSGSRGNRDRCATTHDIVGLNRNRCECGFAHVRRANCLGR